MIKVDKKDFKNAIKFVSQFLSKGSLPVLRMIRIIPLDRTGLVLTAGDLESFGTMEIPAKIESGSDPVIVDPKLLASLIDAAPGAEVLYHASKADNSASVNGIVLQGMSADEWPAEIGFSGKTFELSSNTLVGAEFAAIVVKKKDGSALECIQFLDNHIVGTDRFRLHLYKTEKPVQKTMLISADIFKKFPSKYSGSINCRFDKDSSPDFIRFRLGDCVITTRLCQAQYPQIKEVIKLNPSASLIFKRKELETVLAMLLKIGKAAFRLPLVRFEDQKLDTEILLSLYEYEGKKQPGQVLNCEIRRIRPDNLNVAVNARLLLDTVEALDSDEIVLHLSGLLSAVAVQEVTTHHKKMALVMPIKQTEVHQYAEVK